MYIPSALVASGSAHDSEEFIAAAAAVFADLERQHPDLSHLSICKCGGRRAAAIWFVKECEALGGRIPLQLLLAGQRTMIAYALGQIEQVSATHDGG